MAIQARVLADSVNPVGDRLTTMEWHYPRCIHSEIMTHRDFSRCAASSRAIPVAKLIQRVVDDPFVPEWWGKNEPGMQARAELSPDEAELARAHWLYARDRAVESARRLAGLGLHKQVVNRLIEPFMWITVIVSATEWENFFALRCHPDAEPHFYKLACLARDAMAASKPRPLAAGEWHLPLVDLQYDFQPAAAIVRKACPPIADDNLSALARAVEALLVKVSVARCARVSYLTHDGHRDLTEDLRLYDKLVASRPLHASPAEHVAYALDHFSRVGNFVGWVQHRKELKHEYVGRAR